MLQRTTSCHGRELISMTDRIVKRHSFSGKKDIFFLKNIKKINVSNASLNLKRVSAVSNLYRLDQDNFLNYSKKIEFSETTVSSNINSKDYVYCGMASSIPINNFGISVDYEGNLILINGDAYDLFSGLKNKYISGYKYKIAKITDNKCKIKIDNLYVNKDGLLIGDEKVTGKSYILNITVPSCMSDPNDEEIVINFLDYIKIDGVDNLTFNVDSDAALSFSFKNNKIYLKSILEKGKINDFDLMNFEISVPLKKTKKF